MLNMECNLHGKANRDSNKESKMESLSEMHNLFRNKLIITQKIASE